MGTVNVLEAVRAGAAPACARSSSSPPTSATRTRPGGARPFTEDDPLGGGDPYSSSKACAELVAAAYRARSSPATARHAARDRPRRQRDRRRRLRARTGWSPTRCARSSPARRCCVRNPHAVRPWQHVLEPARRLPAAGRAARRARRRSAARLELRPAGEESRPVGWIAARLARALGGRARMGRRTRRRSRPRRTTSLLDSSAAESELGWRPPWGLEEALARTVEWHRRERARRGHARGAASSRSRRFARRAGRLIDRVGDSRARRLPRPFALHRRPIRAAAHSPARWRRARHARSLGGHEPAQRFVATAPSGCCERDFHALRARVLGIVARAAARGRRLARPRRPGGLLRGRLAGPLRRDACAARRSPTRRRGSCSSPTGGRSRSSARAAATSREPRTRSACGRARPRLRELDDRTRLRQLLEGMRCRLDLREREAAALCYLHGYSRAQAARRMGISETRMRKLMEGAAPGRAGVAAKVGALVETITAGEFCDAAGVADAGARVRDARPRRRAPPHRARPRCATCPACRRHVAVAARPRRGAAAGAHAPRRRDRPASPRSSPAAAHGGGAARGLAGRVGGGPAPSRRAPRRPVAAPAGGRLGAGRRRPGGQARRGLPARARASAPGAWRSDGPGGRTSSARGRPPAGAGAARAAARARRRSLAPRPVLRSPGRRARAARLRAPRCRAQARRRARVRARAAARRRGRRGAARSRAVRAERAVPSAGGPVRGVARGGSRRNASSGRVSCRLGRPPGARLSPAGRPS